MTQKLTLADMQGLASTRNHTILIWQNYQDVRSKITIRCTTCAHVWTTAVASYKNARKTGCPGCKKSAISRFQVGKVVSEKTRQAIGEKARQRPGSLTGRHGTNHPRFTGGSGRDLSKPSHLDYAWKNAVRKRFQGRCFFTGTRANLVAHHLNAFAAYPEQGYDPKNGVLIARHIHQDFHNRYGYGRNTEAQWIAFCQDTYQLDWVSRQGDLVACSCSRRPVGRPVGRPMDDAGMEVVSGS